MVHVKQYNIERKKCKLLNIGKGNLSSDVQNKGHTFEVVEHATYLHT